MRSLALFALGLALVGRLFSASLTLERTIPLPGVEGRIDHFTLDAVGQRLFVAALGNNTVEVVSLERGQVVQSITGLTEPQGVCFVGETNRLYVANGGDGTLRIFDATTFAEKARVKLEDDADNVRYDPAGQRIYVGHGSGVLGAVEVTKNQIVAAIPLKGHPESFQLEQNGPRIFVNVPSARQIAVIDRQKRAVIATWSIGLAAANFPMALDETNHRLMIGCRVPARMMVFDTESGKEVAKLELHGDCDDLFFDPIRRQLYASCGEGFIDVFSQNDPDHYSLKESVKTENKARTSSWEGGHFYLAAPKQRDRAAEVICYRVEQ